MSVLPVSLDLCDAWRGHFYVFSLPNDFINLFQRSAIRAAVCVFPGRFFSFHPPLSRFVRLLLFFPSDPQPSRCRPTSTLLLFPPYSLIAHNHSQSVSVTNGPIRQGRSGRGVWSGPCGRQAASVVASAIRSPSLHVCLACLILCDSEGNRGGGGVGVSRLGGACDRGFSGHCDMSSKNLRWTR